jgi:hypothetical protein
MFLTKHFSDEPEGSEIDDVIRNLGFVLSTKRGYGYFLESFGLTDTGFRTTEEMVLVMSREIAENIRLYEPRVALLDIDEVYDKGRARLVVNLRMRDRDEKLKLVVDLTERKFDITPVAPKKGEGK